jgi:hypothetical protein
VQLFSLGVEIDGRHVQAGFILLGEFIFSASMVMATMMPSRV